MLDGDVVTNGWGALNTLLNVLGPALIILTQWFVSRGVKKKLAVSNEENDKKLNKIIKLANSTLSIAQEHVYLLSQQLIAAGITPVPAPIPHNGSILNDEESVR